MRRNIFPILRAKQIVSSRKEGNQVFYSVRDPLLIEVLDIMRRYFQAHVEEAMPCSKRSTDPTRRARE